MRRRDDVSKDFYIQLHTTLIWILQAAEPIISIAHSLTCLLIQVVSHARNRVQLNSDTMSPACLNSGRQLDRAHGDISRNTRSTSQ